MEKAIANSAGANVTYCGGGWRIAPAFQEAANVLLVQIAAVPQPVALAMCIRLPR